MHTRESILDQVLKELNRHPGASMAELASAAGIGRATLHRHFESREALLAEIGDRALGRWEAGHAEAGIVAATASGDPVRIEATLRTMIGSCVADAEDFGFALTDDFIVNLPALADRLEALIDREAEFYAAAQAAGVVRRDLPARWVGHTAYGLMIATRDALNAGDVARRDVADLVATTLLDGVRAR